ncbi:response regulator transcription factor [Christensenella minuta]|uniref:response regulator transcription factor n=1 Tax=Christensenella minuta TaxID=626937 RepID=UPI002A80CBD6|nr:response regulator transcription factor [Christensenella minuta]MDY3752227.1 response regulator transcription factor [Christensenella minuta]
MIKILIVEDQELIRQSLEIILSSQPGLSVIGLAGNGNEAVEMAGALSPDVILLDIRMPGMDGVSACRIIKEKYPGIKIIVLTTFDDDEYVFDAIKYGANGYLLKGTSVDKLANAIRTVYNNGTLINPAIASKLVGFFSKIAKGDIPIPRQEPSLTELNQRENDIVKQVCKGYSNKEIAHTLFLSEGTVRNSISTILAKLNLRDRTQLVLYCLRRDMGETHE